MSILISILYGHSIDTRSILVWIPSKIPEVCTECGEPAHDGQTCNEAEAARDPALAELLRSEHWTRCPHCRAATERVAGCNFMTCASEKSSSLAKVARRSGLGAVPPCSQTPSARGKHRTLENIGPWKTANEEEFFIFDSSQASVAHTPLV